jgi:hypothetical protein
MGLCFPAWITSENEKPFARRDKAPKGQKMKTNNRMVPTKNQRSIKISSFESESLIIEIGYILDQALHLEMDSINKDFSEFFASLCNFKKRLVRIIRLKDGARC